MWAVDGVSVENRTACNFLDDEPGLLGVGSCTYFIGNYIHDNINPVVTGVGTAELGPVGTGIVLSDGRYDTIAFNRIEHKGAWGVLLAPFPDTGTPPPVADYAGVPANPCCPGRSVRQRAADEGDISSSR